MKTQTPVVIDEDVFNRIIEEIGNILLGMQVRLTTLDHIQSILLRCRTRRNPSVVKRGKRK